MDSRVIRYEFATGEVVHVEVDAEIAEVICKSRRMEHANNERTRYHAAFSMDSDDCRCAQLISTKTPDDHVIELEERQHLVASMTHLSEVQRQRLLLMAEGRTIAEIARLQHAAYNSVKDSIRAAQQKIRKKF
mgnify:CR=1 FL=1